MTAETKNRKFFKSHLIDIFEQKKLFSVNILRRSGEGEKMIKLGLVFHRVKSPGGAASLPE